MKKLQLIFFCSLFIFSLGCKKKPTIWESDWSVPVVDDTLSLNNLVNDSTLSIAPGGTFELDLTRTLLNLQASDIIDFRDTTITYSYSIVFPEILINPGYPFVNEVNEHDLDIPDVQLKKIILKKGYIDFEIRNPLQTVVFTRVQIPGVKKDGVTFDQEYSTPPGTMANPGIKKATIDLSGYEMDLTGIDGNLYNMLRTQITVRTDPNGPQVPMTNQDVAIVQATFRDVKIDYARGYFGNLLVSQTSDFFVEALNLYESGALDIANTSIVFTIDNYIKAGAEGKINNVSNENNAGVSVDLSGGMLGQSLLIDPATGSWSSLTPSHKEIEFNSSNSNIEAYLENLGNKHTVDYSLELNPWGNNSGSWDEIFPGTAIKVQVKAKMPLSVGMDNLTLKDTFDLNLNQDDTKTHIKSGSFVLNATNAFPFSGNIQLLLLDDNMNLLHTLSGSDKIESANFGSLNPKHDLYTANSEIYFSLNEGVINDLSRIKKVIIYTVLNSIDPSTGISNQMIIPANAFLSVKLRTRFTTENIIQ